MRNICWRNSFSRNAMMLRLECCSCDLFLQYIPIILYKLSIIFEQQYILQQIIIHSFSLLTHSKLFISVNSVVQRFDLLYARKTNFEGILIRLRFDIVEPNSFYFVFLKSNVVINYLQFTLIYGCSFLKANQLFIY